MCPACLSAVTVALVGATSTGGLAALLATKLRARRRAGPRPDWPAPRGSRASRGEE